MTRIGGETERRMLLALRNGVIDKASLRKIGVRHDAGCQLRVAATECTCDPVFVVREKRLTLLPDGTFDLVFEVVAP
ncbi:MAG TPA: hypothetical protein VJL07_02660 [Dehalococcoidia bacterium]|nr:hypothetical protein [Dehalococcoidia bacterium]